MGAVSRGKAIITNEWVYGQFITSGENFHGGKKSYIAVDGECDNYLGKVFIEVDPKTVGEFTHLFDKNRKVIFRGDIVKISRFGGEAFVIGDVCFDHGYFSVRNGIALGTDVLGKFASDIVEIIGTIYENPELLKKGEV